MNFRRLTAAVVISSLAVSSYAYAANFTDTQGHWAEEIINTLSDAGIVNGVGGDRFNPDGTVTRAEFVRMALGAAGIGTTPYRAGECLDVSANDWFAPYVQSALDKGLIPEGMIRGYSVEEKDNKITFGGVFSANTPIKREEMAYITQSVYQYSLGDGELQNLEIPVDMPFEDVSAISRWAAEGVRYAYTNELIFGMDNGTFAPQSTATRAQAASIINNLLKKQGV